MRYQSEQGRVARVRLLQIEQPEDRTPRHLYFVREVLQYRDQFEKRDRYCTYMSGVDHRRILTHKVCLELTDSL